MKRRDMLRAAGAAALGLSTFPFGWAAAARNSQTKILYFTRCAGFEHSVVKRLGKCQVKQPRNSLLVKQRERPRQEQRLKM